MARTRTSSPMRSRSMLSTPTCAAVTERPGWRLPRQWTGIRSTPPRSASTCTQFTNANASPALRADRLLHPFDPLRRFVEDRRDLVKQTLVESIAADTVAERGHQISDGATDRRSRARPLVRSEIGQSLEQGIDLVCPLLEVLAPIVGRLERLARTLDRRLLDQAHVLQQGQCRINHPGAR